MFLVVNFRKFLKNRNVNASGTVCNLPKMRVNPWLSMGTNWPISQKKVAFFEFFLLGNSAFVLKF